MARQRVWYAKYVGYCFNDNGEEVILNDVFYWEGDEGEQPRTGYELYYPKTQKWVMTDLSEMRRIAKQTNLPK